MRLDKLFFNANKFSMKEIFIKIGIKECMEFVVDMYI